MKTLQDLLSGYSLETLILYTVAVVAILRQGKTGSPGAIIGLLELFKKTPVTPPQSSTKK